MWYVLLFVFNSQMHQDFKSGVQVCLHVLQISEKQKTLYEALEKQQRYQGSLQTISTKMESIESRLNEPPMHDLSPDRQIVLHQVRRLKY